MPLPTPLRGFALGFAVRGGLVLLYRLFRYSRALSRRGSRSKEPKEPHGQPSAYELTNIYGLPPLPPPEKDLSLGALRDLAISSLRTGATAAAYIASFNALAAFFARLSKNTRRNVFLAGALSSIWVLLEHHDLRVPMSHYLLVRAAQVVYKALQKKHNWGANYGDMLLFGLACAQVMHAYVFRPHSVPDAYYRFVVNTGPIPEVTLHNMRRLTKDKPVELEKLNRAIEIRGGPRNYVKESHPKIFDCQVLHPGNRSCIAATFNVFRSTYKKSFNYYLALNMIPLLLSCKLNIFKIKLSNLFKALIGTARSTLFLAVFCYIYQSIICLHRNLVKYSILPGGKDWRYIYWLSGLVSGASVLVEKKSRRAELALYVLPKGVESYYEILCEKGLASKVKWGEVGLVGLAMGIIMKAYCCDRDIMPPLLNTLLGAFFGSSIKATA